MRKRSRLSVAIGRIARQPERRLVMAARLNQMSLPKVDVAEAAQGIGLRRNLANGSRDVQRFPEIGSGCRRPRAEGCGSQSAKRPCLGALQTVRARNLERMAEVPCRALRVAELQQS